MGCAIGSACVLRRGIYISINGRTYEAAHCTRDPSTGVFIGDNLVRPGITRPGPTSSTSDTSKDVGVKKTSEKVLEISEDEGSDWDEHEALTALPVNKKGKTSVTTAKAKAITSSMKALNLSAVTGAPAPSSSPKLSSTSSLKSSPRKGGEAGGTPTTRKAIRARKSSSEKKVVS